MPRKTSLSSISLNSYVCPDEGFPKRIYWKIIAGNRKLSILEQQDVIFTEKEEFFYSNC